MVDPTAMITEVTGNAMKDRKLRMMTDGSTVCVPVPKVREGFGTNDGSERMGNGIPSGPWCTVGGRRKNCSNWITCQPFRHSRDCTRSEP